MRPQGWEYGSHVYTPPPIRKPSPTDVGDEEWAFVASYLTLLPEDVGQRRHGLRAVFNAVRWMVRVDAPWRLLPNDFPRGKSVSQQTLRWRGAGCFEALVHDLRLLLRALADRHRQPRPSAAILDARTLQSTRESGGAGRAGYDGHKRRHGSKLHLAVDTLGHLLALVVPPPTSRSVRKSRGWRWRCRRRPGITSS